MAERSNTVALIGILIGTAVGAAVAWAGSDGGDRVGNIPVFALCGALAFAINWIAFIPSAIAQTEHYYDLVGGITYITVTIAAVLLSTELDLRSAIVAGMVLIWSSRLAVFLFRRIARAGKDSRFDEIKTSLVRFLMAWTIQGLWVLLTAAAALAVITGGKREPLDVIGYAGIVIWLAGFLIEVVADRQKSNFKADPANEGRYIDVGLWAWSRHPNYFAEQGIWISFYLFSVAASGQWINWSISGCILLVILFRGSSNFSEEISAGKYPRYAEYQQKVPRFIPLRFR